MHDDLGGAVALVSGAGRGMGAAHARRLAASNARVVIADIDETTAGETAEQLRDDGFDVSAEPLDVADRESWRGVLTRTAERKGPVRILVNNAGVLGGPESFVDADDYERVVAVNQTGTYLGMQAALPGMIAAGGGAIVNVASIAAHAPSGSVAYCASKAAVITMTRVVAQQYGRHNIRANVVSPGLIRTPMTAGSASASQSTAELAIPLGRWGEPQDVSEAIVFLAGDRAAYISGAEIAVDGGRVGQMLR